MNKEEILNKYKDSLDILCGYTSNLIVDEIYSHREKIRQIQCSNNIVEKSFSNIVRIFNREDALMYSTPCLFFINEQWYKYNGNHPEQIHLNNAIALNNTELFKLIKRSLFNMEKNYIISYFLVPECALNLEELNVIKTHLIEFKNLTINSQTYQEIKIVLEHLLTIEEKFIVY